MLNGLLGEDDLKLQIGALCSAVPASKGATAIQAIPLVLSSIVCLRVRTQDERHEHSPLDADEIRMLARLWKKYRGELVGTAGYEHFGPYGWLGRFVLYPATMYGFAERWEEMLAEARDALGHEGIHCAANHKTHAQIALAMLVREPDDALIIDDEELNEWGIWTSWFSDSPPTLAIGFELAYHRRSTRLSSIERHVDS